MQPHLLALLQVMQRAIGATPDPRMTPMKVWRHKLGQQIFRRQTLYGTHIEPTHGDTDVEEDHTRQTTDKGVECNL